GAVPDPGRWFKVEPSARCRRTRRILRWTGPAESFAGFASRSEQDPDADGPPPGPLPDSPRKAIEIRNPLRRRASTAAFGSPQGRSGPVRPGPRGAAWALPPVALRPTPSHSCWRSLPRSCCAHARRCPVYRPDRRPSPCQERPSTFTCTFTSTSTCTSTSTIVLVLVLVNVLVNVNVPGPQTPGKQPLKLGFARSASGIGKCVAVP